MRLADLDPTHAPAALAASREPFLVGVRHHSAALAAAMPKILASFSPTVILVELPADLGAWLPWLASPELEAPVALSATTKDGSLAFYPFADFSPELAALRWAREMGIPAEAIDRPVGADPIAGPEDSARAGRLLSRLEGGDDIEALWDTMVEARAPGSPEDLRRAALSFGWLLRADTLHGGGVPAEDAARESYMRARVSAATGKKGARVCAIVGAFHANALLATPVLEAVPALEEAVVAATPAERLGALVPYDFELLDSRSGYPAGVRDPSLVQRAFELFSRGEPFEAALPEVLVSIARELRGKGHLASFSDLHEAARLARDLASLRKLESPGRRELLEAIESTMARGEPLGRGRALARALSVVLVGHRRGRLPDDAPRSGLAVSVDALLDDVGLPGARSSKEAKEMTLDPSRSPLDRRRAVVLGQLAACAIPYAEKRGSTRGRGGARADVVNLTMRVSLRYTPETAARLEIAGLFGTTLSAAAEGALRRSFAKLVDEGKEVAKGFVEHVALAATAGLPQLVGGLLDQIHEVLVPAANLADLASATMLVAQIDAGLVATLPRGPSDGDGALRSFAPEREALLLASLRALIGMTGTTDEDEIRAFAELLAVFADHDIGSLAHAVDTFVTEGSPLVRGAAMAARVLLDREPAETFFATFVSLFDHGGNDLESANLRTATIRGALLLAAPVFEGHPRFAEAITEGIERLSDARFLACLPSLRGGFDVLSAGDRERLLAVLGANVAALDLDVSARDLGVYAIANRAGEDALVALALDFGETPTMPPGVSVARVPSPKMTSGTENGIGIHDRLRLVLGRHSNVLPPNAVRYARALDELYGHGQGEGSRGGTGESFPTAREWGDELSALFGESVREEVLGSAAKSGNGAALALLDPSRVTPSIDLLEHILSLKGGLSDREFSHLKLLAQRIVEALVKELATRASPALTGLATPRTSCRRRGPLDLRKTIEANLATAYVYEDSYRLAPRDFVFRSRAKKSLDWRIVLVVDVSGSMEPSVIHSAMMAGILGNLPAVSSHFVAVNDKVVDLSSRAADPLELLLSVQIGGGTLLAKGLRYARSLLTVPSRSIVVLVSDFEEGGSVAELLAEARALKDAGATLLGLAALGENHAPRYHRAIAERLVNEGMPIAALSPLELARWVGEKMRGIS